MESQATEENTNLNNLSFTKGTCRHCLTIKDTISKLVIIKKGRTEYLGCPNCYNNYCTICFNKVTIRKSGYPYCYCCYRRNRNLMKDGKDLGTCVKHRCNQPATVQGTIYNKKTDDLVIGNFCRKHYDHFYYYIKLKTSTTSRVSYGKRKHTQKRTNNRSLIYTKNVRTNREEAFQKPNDCI